MTNTTVDAVETAPSLFDVKERGALESWLFDCFEEPECQDEIMESTTEHLRKVVAREYYGGLICFYKDCDLWDMLIEELAAGSPEEYCDHYDIPASRRNHTIQL